MGGAIRAVLTDISAPLLRHVETSAARREIKDQCTFIQCSAEKLSGIADSTIDSIVTRASIAYVFDKKAAFGEFHRVLKPGGRISIAEPILQDEAFASRALRKHVESLSPAPANRFLRLLHRCKAAQYPDTEEGYAKNPLVNFSERDLLNHLRGAGFSDIHLELHIDVAPSLIRSWEVFLDASPHPWAPPLRKILAEQFSPEERRLFEELVRPGIESGTNTAVERIVFVNARKSANP
jgi:ubiquinone/menaquinone biosynthesis C-methylase UbiE